MNLIIQSALKTLQKSQALLKNLSNDQLCDTSIPPYNSSVGTHIRHILDFYDCIFTLNSENKIDLTKRSRDKNVESDCNCAQNYLDSITEKLNSLAFNMSDTVLVIDDLGMGKTETPYTYGALLSQANSHTIHHYAIINYILEGLNISINDPDFGYNPTTPKTANLN